ncbi:MAG: hypothetical protein EA383_01285 [Spirochaetaceae bacterium]|nr:MAG: hypothetical protein EA383_01285 [Spirochaetaceae bacterium]
MGISKLIWVVLLALSSAFIGVPLVHSDEPPPTAAIRLVSDTPFMLTDVDVYIDGQHVHVDADTGIVSLLSSGVRYLEILQHRFDERVTLFQRAVYLEAGTLQMVYVRMPILGAREWELLNDGIEHVDKAIMADTLEKQRQIDVAVASAVAQVDRSNASAAAERARSQVIYYPVQSIRAVRDFAELLHTLEQISPHAVEYYEWYLAERMMYLYPGFNPNPDPAEMGFFSPSLFTGYGHMFSGLGGGVGLTWNVPLSSNRHFLMDWYYGQGVIDGLQSGAFGARLGVQVFNTPAQTGPYLGVGFAAAGIGTNRELSFRRRFSEAVEAGEISAFSETRHILGLGIIVFLDYMFRDGIRLTSEIGVLAASLDDSDRNQWPVHDFLPNNESIGVLSASFGVALSLAEWFR